MIKKLVVNVKEAKMKVVPIIMTYNEKENIGPMLDAWIKIAKENPKYDFYPLVVDGNSPDGTGDIVREYQKKHKKITLLSGPRLGYGKELSNAYRYSMEKMNADVIIPIDVDFQWDPFMAPKMLQKIDEGYDVVVPSRALPGSKDNFTPFRKLTHYVSDTLLAYYFAGIKEVKDHAGSFKAIRIKGVLDKVNLKNLDVVGFVIQMKTIYELSKTGAKFVELPATYAERRAGVPTTVGMKSIKWFIKYIIEYFINAAKIRVERSRQFFRFCVVGGIGFVINTLGLRFFAESAHWHPAAASAAGAEFAIISNFILNNFWTFQEKKITVPIRMVLKFLQFNLTSVGAIIIQFVVVWLGVKLFGRPLYMLYFVIAVSIGLVWNYFMYTHLVWKTKK